jgi:hypothetical protein
MPRTRRQKTQEHEAENTEADTTEATTRRRTTRSSARKMKVEDDNEEVIPKYYKDSKELTQGEDEEDSEDDDEEKTQRVYILDGVNFNNYQDFVDAKRKRNEKVLMGLGFGPSSSSSNKRLKVTDGSTMPSQRGLKSNKKKSSAKKAPPVRSRISSRISGDKTKLVALDLYVNDWNKDNTAFVVTQNGEDGGEDVKDNNNNDKDQQEVFFNGRVNDGSDLNIKDAIEMNDPKWIHDESEINAQNLFKELTLVEEEESTIETSECKMTKKNNNSTRTRTSSPTSIMAVTTKDTSSWDDDQITDMVSNLSIDKEEWVAKVTPDRIYSVACHPSESKLICCAGDKKGYVGLWDVDGGTSSSENNTNDISVKNSNGVSLFRVHSRPICCLEWLNNENMVTASYDGSVRRLNVETGTFEEIFATYDDSDTTYLEDLGYGLDLGYRYWTQNVTVDHRYKGASNPCLFVSTSVGNVFHVDLRVSEKQKITFHESVSQKKLNTVRYVYLL